MADNGEQNSGVSISSLSTQPLSGLTSREQQGQTTCEERLVTLTTRHALALYRQMINNEERLYRCPVVGCGETNHGIVYFLVHMKKVHGIPYARLAQGAGGPSAHATAGQQVQQAQQAVGGQPAMSSSQPSRPSQPTPPAGHSESPGHQLRQ